MAVVLLVPHLRARLHAGRPMNLLHYLGIQLLGRCGPLVSRKWRAATEARLQEEKSARAALEEKMQRDLLKDRWLKD